MKSILFSLVVDRASRVLGAAVLLGLSAAAPACDLQFTQGGTSLTYPVPGTTTAITSFSFTNISDQACVSAPGQSAGIVVNGVLDPASSAVIGTSIAPFSLAGQLVSPNGALGCTIYGGSNSVACQTAVIPAGASYVVQLTFTANQTITPPFCFQAASYNNGVPNTFFNAFSSPDGYDAISGCAGPTGGGGGNPRLIVSKRDLVDPVVVGEQIQYEITVRAQDQGISPGPIVSDTLPAGVSYAGFSGPPGWTCDHDSGVVSCNSNANFPSGAVANLLLYATADQAGTVVNACTAVAPGGAGPPVDDSGCTEDTTILAIPRVDLNAVKTSNTPTVPVGGALTYIIEVSNSGPDSAPSGSVIVTDTLPTGTQFVSAIGSGWNCGHSSGAVTCSLSGALPSGTTAAPISITVQVRDTAGPITNTCVVEATGTSDPTPADPDCTETNTVEPRADLAIDKTDAVDPVAAGATVTYQLAVTNFGPSAASAVVVSDTLPAGTTFQAAGGSGWSCSHNSGTLTCSRASAAIGSLPAITVEVRAPAGSGAIVNAASVTSTTADPDPDNNSDTETTQVTGLSGLAISKTDSVDPVQATAAYSYTLGVTNLGPSAAVNAVVSDTLPIGVVYASAAGAGWSCAHAAGTVSCTRPTLAVGTSSIVINVTAPAIAGTVLNTATISSGTPDSNPADNSASEPTTVLAASDLDVVKTVAPNPARVGQTVAFGFVLSNAGPSPASGVQLVDAMPPQFVYQGFVGTGWSCSHAGGTVTCSLSGSVAAGASATPLTINTRAISAGDYTNVCVATADAPDVDGTPSCEVDGVVNPPRVDLNAIKSSSTPTVPAGGTLTYTIMVRNNGPDAAPAGSMVVTDTLPTGTTFQAATGGGWSCTHATGTVTCALGGALASADTASPISISVTVPATPGQITNTCVVEADGTTDPTPDDPDCAETNTVQPPLVDLNAVKSSTTPSVPAGGTLNYTIAVSNNGPGAAPAGSVVVTDALPPGTSFQTATGNGWSCAHAAGTVTCTLSGGLASGALASPITIGVTVPATPGPITNTCVVEAAGTTDPTPADPDCTETNTVQPPTVDLNAVKSSTTPTVLVGGTLVYTIAVSNNGPGTAPAGSVVVNDTLPAGTTYQSATGTGWNCTHSIGTVNCALSGALVSGATAAPISISVEVPATPGPFTNTCVVEAAGTTDPTQDDPDCTETNTVSPLVANLDILKIATPNVVALGQSVSFDFAVKNLGPDPATGIRFVDQMPTAFEIVAASGEGWDCVIEGQTVSCSMSARLSVGQSAPPVVIEAIARTPGQHQNVCVGTVNQVDQDGTPACQTVVTVTPPEATPIPVTSRLALLLLIIGMLVAIAVTTRR